MSYRQKVLDRIQKYKSYDQETKDRVSKQLNREVTESEFNNIQKRLPAVMKANAEFVKRANKLHKSVIKLERHTYAPELNCLHLKGGKIIKTPGANTIEEAVEQIINNNKDK